FGQGIVRTPSDFGRQGEVPTHPQLLEWLSAEFVAHGWDVKWLHRQIVLSSTYRQSSTFDETSHRVDPENRLLWRMNRRRLSIEMWRDAMLAVAGNLDRTLGGESVPLEEAANHRRTIYGKIARRELDQMLRMYDFPDPNSHSPNRTPTTTPLQQLFVLNAPFVEQQARSLYDALPKDVSPSEQLAFGYRRLFAREPTADELELGLRFLLVDQTTETGGEISPQRWQSYLHAMLGLNEFLYVD
ncbi:MAG TPA: DUF1553 domain-containing protein, partial [Planctomycetaceae bacterium]|nr:DUF1553 domain-containing protein [Planctomycetaceae bacterium]